MLNMAIFTAWNPIYAEQEQQMGARQSKAPPIERLKKTGNTKAITVKKNKAKMKHGTTTGMEPK
jgi:hypothetical protein